MNHFSRWLGLFIIVFFLAPSISRAKEPLGEVKVTDNSQDNSGSESKDSSLKILEATQDSSAFSQTISSKKLEGRRTSLPEVLQEVTGVQIKNYGGLDDFATISLRGSTSEQVAIFVDGILLNQSAGRGVNIANIPTEQIERIEVYKGFAPLSFGVSPMGGVVNIITKKASQTRKTTLSQSYGSFNTYDASLLHAQGLGRFSFETGYTYHHTDGNFSYVNDNGTPNNNTDDHLLTRKNNHLDRHALLNSFKWNPTSDWTLLFHNQFFREDRGIPGLANLTSDNAHLSTTRFDTSLDLKKNFEASYLQTSPFFQFLKEQFDDPLGEIGLGIENNDNETFHYGNQLTWRTIVGKHQSITLLNRYHGEDFFPKDYAKTPIESPASHRHHLTFGIEDEILLLDNKLTLNPSFRNELIWSLVAEAPNDFQNLFSGKIGAKYQPFTPWTLKTNFARNYRLPNFSELFGDRGDLIGNPSLTPESSWNWDIGFSFGSKPVVFELSYYLNHQKNLIQFLQTSQLTARAQNLQSARLQGFEALATFHLGKYLVIDENYTLQLATDTSGLPGLDGKTIPGRPVHTWNQKFSLINSWGKSFVETFFIGKNYLDTQNLLEVKSRFLVNLGVSAKFFKTLTTSLEAKNIFNNRIADVVGYPLPGRSFYAKLEVNF